MPFLYRRLLEKSLLKLILITNEDFRYATCVYSTNHLSFVILSGSLNSQSLGSFMRNRPR